MIVSLEVHANSDQQDMMVEIMKEVWHERLVEPLLKERQGLPSLAELKHKILVKVKAGSSTTVPEAVTKAEQLPIDDSTSSSDSEVDEKSQQSSLSKKKKGRKKKNAITGALSEMGIYTRGYHFKGFSSPEAKIPTHIFSLSEKKLMDISDEHGPQLLAHNRQYLMRAFPSGTRLASTNFDPSVYWRMGVQIAALNWQSFDAVRTILPGITAHV